MTQADRATSKPRRRWRDLPKAVRVVAFVVVASVSLGVGATLALSWHVGRTGQGRIFERPKDAAPAQVALVLGAAVNPNGVVSVALQDRLQCALELFELGKVQTILVSGDHAAPEYDEVHAMRAWLLARGVPADRVFMDHAGVRTFDSMVRAAQVFEVDTAIVCTQRFHLPRSLYLADAAGLDAQGVAADRRVYTKHAEDERREFYARVLAWLDVNVLDTQPRHLGPKIPIARKDAR